MSKLVNFLKAIEFWPEKEIRKYDKRNNLVYEKVVGYYAGPFRLGARSVYEYWYKYDENNNRIKITEKEHKEVELREKEKVEYIKKNRFTRFEIMDI